MASSTFLSYLQKISGEIIRRKKKWIEPDLNMRAKKLSPREGLNQNINWSSTCTQYNTVILAV